MISAMFRQITTTPKDLAVLRKIKFPQP